MAERFTFVPQTTGPVDGRRHLRGRFACPSCRAKKRRCNHGSSRTSRLDSSVASREPGSIDVNSNSDASSRSKRRAVSMGGGEVGNGRNRVQTEKAGDVSGTTRGMTAEGTGNHQLRNSLRDLTRAEPISPTQISNVVRSQRNDRRNSESTHSASRDSGRRGLPAKPRYVGQLDPESRLLDINKSPEDIFDTYPKVSGIWVHENASDAQSASHSATSSVCDHGEERTLTTPSISDILSKETVTGLSELYLMKIHPLLPILNVQEYRQSLYSGTVSTALAHAICLVAAKDHTATAQLKLLETGDTIVPVRRFCSKIYKSVKDILNNGARIQKLTAIRVMALLSLHHEGRDGAEDASNYNAQAAHKAQSLAIHHRQPRDEAFELKRLFWCLWILDRFNSVTHSRPCIMFDRDIAVDYITPEQSGSVAFDILFRISKTLNEVIGLYRPTHPGAITGIDTDFPGFEQIVDDAKGWNLAPSMLDTLHLFYLSTAVLSYRLKTIHSPPTTTPARLRQQFSAVQIIRCLKVPLRLKSIHPFPIIAYATSQALSISYQQLRYSRLPIAQENARDDFNEACKILQELRQTWASADIMASLALKISAKINKVSSLDVIRADRSATLYRDGTQPPEQRVASMNTSNLSDENVNQSMFMGDMLQGQAWDSATSNLFGGMDDMSWMYLDAENPVNVDLLPLQEFWPNDTQY